MARNGQWNKRCCDLKLTLIHAVLLLHLLLPLEPGVGLDLCPQCPARGLAPGHPEVAPVVCGQSKRHLVAGLLLQLIPVIPCPQV